jgi:hypothetical protein
MVSLAASSHMALPHRTQQMAANHNLTIYSSVIKPTEAINAIPALGTAGD